MMAETKQGVAQRVLSAIPGNPRLTEFEAICCHAGAEEMLKQLSAEARAVLAEEGFERRPQIVAVLTEAFTRLGLDLNGEDS